jgi:hypothetical protein
MKDSFQFNKNVVAGLGNSTDQAVVPRAKLIAMFFPQFHAIPENDAWWGQGFTDWDNVKSSQPQYPGHYQPRIPLQENYYDQSDLATLRGQIDLARAHGIHGFCHYHYWFNGKQLLQTPTDLVIAHRDIDFPFCLSWANETWSRRWDGRDNHVLIAQTHPPTQESWRAHYDYLIKAWSDPRAIKVNGKPIFVIYRPQNIIKIDEMLAFWRALAKKDGLPGLYFIFQKTHDLGSFNSINSFDAVFQFQPFEAVHSSNYDRASVLHSRWFKLVRRLPERYQDILRSLRAKWVRELTFHDYDAAWRIAVEIRAYDRFTTFPGAFVDWDNASRYKRRATVFRGATPQAFAYWFSKMVDGMSQRGLPEDFIFLNAWNEWSESAYLEPDSRYGHQYIDALKAALLPSVQVSRQKPVS